MYSYANDSCTRNCVDIASLIKFLIQESLAYEYIKCSNTPIIICMLTLQCTHSIASIIIHF